MPNDYLYEGPLTEDHFRSALRFAGDGGTVHVGRDHLDEFVRGVMPERTYRVGTPGHVPHDGGMYFQCDERRFRVEPDGACGRIGVLA